MSAPTFPTVKWTDTGRNRPMRNPEEAEHRENEWLARVSTDIPRVPWDRFVNRVFMWKPGEHVALIGPTGQGKTTMLINVLPLHPFVTVFVTKPHDEVMEALVRDGGYLRMERWVALDPMQYPHRVLWPDATHLNSAATQQEVFHDAFERIYRERGWTVAIDELWYIDNVLKLGADVKTYLLQARSLDISLLMATQRPAWVPTEVYSQSTHLMFWRNNDETDLKRISGIGWVSADLIKRAVANLERYQLLYVNTRTGAMARTKCPEVQLTTVRGG